MLVLAGPAVVIWLVLMTAMAAPVPLEVGMEEDTYMMRRKPRPVPSPTIARLSVVLEEVGTVKVS